MRLVSIPRRTRHPPPAPGSRRIAAWSASTRAPLSTKLAISHDRILSSPQLNFTRSYVEAVGSQAPCTLQTIFNPETCRRRGHCPMPSAEGESPQNLYYELHGSLAPDAVKLVFVMGLNASSFAWIKQVEYFASLPNVAVLVFDNRGSGNSTSPKGLYTSRDMAGDAVVLLDAVGWSDPRSLVVVGASLGGMIAMDLARLVPARISTLVLASTKSGYRYNFPTLRTAWLMARFLCGTVWTQRQGLGLTLSIMFPPMFMNLETPSGQTRRQVLEQEFSKRINLSAKAPARGRLGQMAAVLGHRMKEEDFAELARVIPKIAIIQGDSDRIVRLRDANILHRMLPGSAYTVCKGVGHGLTLQVGDYFNSWLLHIIGLRDTPP